MGLESAEHRPGPRSGMPDPRSAALQDPSGFQPLISGGSMPGSAAVASRSVINPYPQLCAPFRRYALVAARIPGMHWQRITGRSGMRSP